MNGKSVVIILVGVLAGFCAALTHVESAYDPMPLDRVIISDQAIPFEGPSIMSEQTPLPLKFWTMGHWLQDGPYDMEQIMLEDSRKCWVQKIYCYPIYKVSGVTNAELRQAKKTSNVENLEIKFNGEQIVWFLVPGTLVGVCRNVQSLAGSWLVVTVDRIGGYVDMNKLEPVGNPG